MSTLQEKRYEIICKVMRSDGIEYGDNLFMSLWEVAHEINNTWNAKYFCNTSKYKSISDHDFVLDWHQHNALFRAIRHGVKNTGITIRKSYENKSEFLIW